MSSVSLGRRLIGVVKQIDIFGAPLQLSIQSQDKAYQSVFGGISTICIYSFSLYYFIYLLFQWQTKSIKPQVNLQTVSKQYDQLQLPFGIFQLSLVDEEFGKYTQRLNQTKYFWNQSVEIIENWDNQVFSAPNPDSYSCGRQEDSAYLFAPLCQNTDESEQMFLRQNRNNSLTTYMDFLLTKCDPKKDDNCITYNQLTKYSQPYWELFVRSQDVDMTNGEILEFESQYFFNLNPNSSMSIFLKIVKATVIVDEGFLWPSYRHTDIVKDVIVSSSQQSASDTVIFIEMTLEKKAQIIYLTYPKITLILSQAGSMFQSLLVIGLIANLINLRHMENFIKDQLLKIYFPSFQKYYFQSSMTGRTIGVRKYGDDNDMNQSHQSKIIALREDILKVLSQKLSILTMIHDMNKLQIAVQQLYPKDFSFYKMNYGLSFDLENDSLGAKQFPRDLDEEDFFKYFDAKGSSSVSFSPTILKVQPYESNEGSSMLYKSNSQSNKIQITSNLSR